MKLFIGGLAITDELRDLYLRSDSSTFKQAAALLLQLPNDLLSVILGGLDDTRDLARLAASCRLLWFDAPTPPPPPRIIGPVEMEMRRRAEARGLHISSSLPEGSPSWVPYLFKADLCDAQRRQAPLAAGERHSIFVDSTGRIHTCGFEERNSPVLGHGWGPDADPLASREIGSPTPVPAMQDTRIVSVATSSHHCLALSAEGEVYSWGDGDYRAPSAIWSARPVPSRIESMSRVERIAAGPRLMCAAVDEDGRLFTWGQTTRRNGVLSSLGYARDPKAGSQPTPKWVEALSEERVVGVAFGYDFTLAVTDAGAVFSFGDGLFFSDGDVRILGHDEERSEVLPRRIEALTQTGRRFVAVAAGYGHALALTEEGELYGWGREDANGHGRKESIPHQLTAFVGQRVEHVSAGDYSSCAVTDKGELYTWGHDKSSFHLGHGVGSAQHTPRRVEALSGVKVAAAAVCGTHTLVADAHGGVWAFGERRTLGLDAPNSAPNREAPGSGEKRSESPVGGDVKTPTPILTLRVRAIKSP